MRRLRTCLLLAVAAAVSAQTPTVVATFTCDGAVREVPADELAMELLRRYRSTPRGKETLDHLVDLHLVRTAAEAKGVFPTAAQVDERLREYLAEFRRQGQEPEKFLASRGISLREFRDYTTLTLALDALVVAALDLADAGQVTNEYRELWLKEARAKQPIELDASALPDGVAARVGGHAITTLELARTLATRAGADERARYVRQVVLRMLLDDIASKNGIEVSEADLEQAVARIRARAEQASGQAVQVGFESVLEALGTNPEEMKRSPVLRAQVIARRWLAREHPAEQLAQRLRDQRDEILRQHGARRRVEILWLRASDQPNEILRRTFDEAMTEAEQLRRQIADGESFARMARTHSDEPKSKLLGGDVGWHHRDSRTLPEPVLEWAFAAPLGQLSPPLRLVDGVCLVRVRDVEPQPTDAVLHQRMLDDLEEQLYRDLLAAADVQLREQ